MLADSFRLVTRGFRFDTISQKFFSGTFVVVLLFFTAVSGKNSPGNVKRTRDK